MRRCAHWQQDSTLPGTGMMTMHIDDHAYILFEQIMCCARPSTLAMRFVARFLCDRCRGIVQKTLLISVIEGLVPLFDFHMTFDTDDIHVQIITFEFSVKMDYSV